MMNPSTPEQRRPLDRRPSPVLFPRIDPYESPTPLPRHHRPVFSDLLERPSFRTLRAADTLLQLATSPVNSPGRLSPYKSTALYSYESAGSSTASHGLSQSQSTFPPTPPPTTPSRCLLTSEPYLNTKVDVLDLSSHLFSSPTPHFLSPRNCELQYPSSADISPVVRENEKRLKLLHPDRDFLPALLDSVQGSPHAKGTLKRSRNPSLEIQPRTMLRLASPSNALARPTIARPGRTRMRLRYAAPPTDKISNDTDSLSPTNYSSATYSPPCTNVPLSSSPPETPASTSSHIPFPSSQTSIAMLSPLSSISSTSPSPFKRAAKQKGKTTRTSQVCPLLPPFGASGSEWSKDDFLPSPPKTRRRTGADKPFIVHTRKRRRARSDDDDDDDDDDFKPNASESKWKRVRRVAEEKYTVVKDDQGEKEVDKRENEAHISTSNDQILPHRTFPPSVNIRSDFALFYRKFWLPQSQNMSDKEVQGATPNPPKSETDLYTPRWVKGRGPTKVGMCPICAELPERGGEGKKVWQSMKFSAFKCYHMQYYHGISPAGAPFSPPTAFRRITRANAGKNEKTVVEQGRCHRCRSWVNVEGVKDVDVKVKEIFWWKHAAACHQGSTIEGERDVFVDA